MRITSSHIEIDTPHGVFKIDILYPLVILACVLLYFVTDEGGADYIALGAFVTAVGAIESLLSFYGDDDDV